MPDDVTKIVLYVDKDNGRLVRVEPSRFRSFFHVADPYISRPYCIENMRTGRLVPTRIEYVSGIPQTSRK